MGKLFEKLRIFISLIFVPIFLLGIFSCSESAEKSSSVSFKIPSELVENIRGGVSARALTNSEYIFIEVSLSGSYSETKTEQLSENAITFSEVPVDSVVYASATIYEEYPDENGESVKTKLYTGKSESITVQEGENQLELLLKKVTDEPETPTEPETPATDEEKDSYGITFENLYDGTVSADKTSAKPDETVTLTATADDGYRIDGFIIKTTDGTSVDAYQEETSPENVFFFTMPKSDVTVSPRFVKRSYSIIFDSAIENGTVETNYSDNNVVYTNEVEIYIAPAYGYKIDSYSITDEEGNKIEEISAKTNETSDENGNPITFTAITIKMPASNVSVKVTFTEVQATSDTEIAITGETGLPTTAGKYKLGEDITISSTWSVPGGSTTLDLNGYGIRMSGSGSGSAISISDGVNLTINDGNTERTHAITLSSYRGTAVSEASGTTSVDSNGSGTVYIKGGYITGGTSTNDRGGAITFPQNASGNGTVTMTGGTLVGNTAGWGGAVFVANSSIFSMSGTASIIYNYGNNTQYASGGAIFIESSATLSINGGTISNNYCEHDGGAIDIAGTAATLNISGGTITDNTSANTYGGGVKIQSAATVNISGSPIIKNNTASGSTSNFHLNEATRLNLDGIEESASIGIHLNAAGVFTSTTDTSYNRTSNFTSDKEGFEITKNADGQLELTAQ
ncbi:MAG: hypothetical protein IKP49_04280 [Treponema sp.]|nr:hypothetical protein [Treponema sp.]